MSNATQHSQQPGDSRRRRSRGGKNRRNNQNDNRRDGERGSRERRGGQSNRSEEFRPQGPRPPRGRPPVKLSWWQKLLKAIGLYKEPAPPARRERKPDEAKPRSEPRAPKSNTRNARSTEGATERPEEAPPKRGRGNRAGDRPRGGDPSTVESNRVYVGNLSYDVTEQDLQELFKGIGGVRNVEIVYNRSTHRSKGYGFVEMLHRDDAVRCVEVLNDQHFMGRKMTVSGAKSKGQDERDDQDETPQREPKQVVLAPLPEFPESKEDEAKAETEAAAEPQIETIVETTTETPAAEAVTPAEAPAEEAKAEPEAAELIEKYGFDEPEKKSEEN